MHISSGGSLNGDTGRFGLSRRLVDSQGPVAPQQTQQSDEMNGPDLLGTRRSNIEPNPGSHNLEVALRRMPAARQPRALN